MDLRSRCDSGWTEIAVNRNRSIPWLSRWIFHLFHSSAHSPREVRDNKPCNIILNLTLTVTVNPNIALLVYALWAPVEALVRIYIILNERGCKLLMCSWFVCILDQMWSGYSSRALSNVNDAVVNARPNVQKSLLRFVNVMHPRLITHCWMIRLIL